MNLLISIHNAINGKSECVCYDTNCNCLGMVMAVDQISKVMNSDKNINRALIVGGQQLQHFGKENDQMVRAIFGDSACAVILEKTEDSNSYFIDNVVYTDSDMYDDVYFPIGGLSNLGDKKPEMSWFKSDEKKAFQSASKSIELLLSRNNVGKSKIKKYYLSIDVFTVTKKLTRIKNAVLLKEIYGFFLYNSKI